ncbi:hypothetical protein AYL99_11865 [Fonsecaea erecta]|uniref:Uncharacterized protein n=1 Tax=Fonsecaea erecta TaxID=1367422 RepID=A0A178Z4G1_9EURO|nr:hypothetical protein AYL99_11865 [Fonsecaea erecta]OAP53985.1 hypothetical protein AYL99_11865 [Fonsecaea erecta]
MAIGQVGQHFAIDHLGQGYNSGVKDVNTHQDDRVGPDQVGRPGIPFQSHKISSVYIPKCPGHVIVQLRARVSSTHSTTLPPHCAQCTGFLHYQALTASHIITRPDHTSLGKDRALGHAKTAKQAKKVEFYGVFLRATSQPTYYTTIQHLNKQDNGCLYVDRIENAEIYGF